jgi:hypothetical protein
MLMPECPRCGGADNVNPAGSNYSSLYCHGCGHKWNSPPDHKRARLAQEEISLEERLKVWNANMEDAKKHWKH